MSKTNFPFSNKQIAGFIKKEYNIPKIATVKKCSGLLNTVFKIECINGSVYYVKYTDKKNSKRILYEVSFLHLFKQNYNYPYLDFIVKTKNGKQIVYKKSFLITLREKVPGKTSTTSRMNATKRYSAGKMIGAFHSKIRNFHRKLTSNIWSERTDIPLLYYMNTPQIYKFKKSIDFMTKKINSASACWWQDNASDIDNLILKYLQMRNNVNCETQIIHGDLDATNITFQGNKAIGLLDWDFLQIAPRILEIGSTLLNKPVSSQSHKPYEFNINEVSEFVRGYNDGLLKKLSRKEISLIPFAFYNMGLQHLLTSRLLFKLPKISDKKLTEFLKLKMNFMKVLEKMGSSWYKKIER